MDNQSIILVYLAGTIFVVMFAVRFFNKNSSDRSYVPRDDDAQDALSMDHMLELERPPLSIYPNIRDIKDILVDRKNDIPERAMATFNILCTNDINNYSTKTKEH